MFIVVLVYIDNNKPNKNRQRDVTTKLHLRQTKVILLYTTENTLK